MKQQLVRIASLIGLSAVAALGTWTPSNAATAHSSRSHGAFVCTRTAFQRGDCLPYAALPGQVPLAAAVSSALDQPAGSSAVTAFLKRRGQHIHDSLQGKLEKALATFKATGKNNLALPDVTVSPQNPGDGVGTAPPGGQNWTVSSYVQYGYCTDECRPYDTVDFTYSISTQSGWTLTAYYKSQNNLSFEIAYWNCDLRLDQGSTSKHLASWSECGEVTPVVATIYSLPATTTVTATQNSWQFGRFTFLLGPGDYVPGAYPAEARFESKRWYVIGSGGTF
jgi:hypothetical protein